MVDVERPELEALGFEVGWQPWWMVAPTGSFDAGRVLVSRRAGLSVRAREHEAHLQPLLDRGDTWRAEADSLAWASVGPGGRTCVRNVGRVSNDPTYTEPGKPFERDMQYIPDRITATEGKSADPHDGPLEAPTWPVEPGRYRLVAAKACPWANRAIIVRGLLGLEAVISMGLAGPTHDKRSWTFDLDPGGVDPVLGYERLQQAFFARDPDYPRGITVPAIVDVPTRAVVTNDFPAITHDFFFEWRDHHRPDAPDLWPDDVRDEMETVMKRVFTEVNNGVYRCGFAGSQEEYEKAYDRLWTAMDWLEERLSDRRYLMGDAITEADVRLFTTLARFDAVYHGHFKCNRNKLTEMPALWGYARDLFQTPGFGDTIDFEQIKRHYYVVHTDINPTGIVPKGPDPEVWLTPHGRATL